MAVIQVKKLSHAALNVKDVAAQTEFYTQMVGLEETGRSGDGRVYLRCNSDHHCLCLSQVSEPGLYHFALEVKGSLAETAVALEKVSIPFKTEDGAEPGHDACLRLEDSDGFHIELIGGMVQVTISSPISMIWKTLSLNSPVIPCRFGTKKTMCLNVGPLVKNESMSGARPAA